MHLYHDQFSERHDLPRIDKPSKFLIVASTSRCGSHMLGHGLQETNCFGFPLEYANPINLAEWKKRLHKEDFHEVMKEIQSRRTSPNGVFGIKIHYTHIREFGGFDYLQAMFPDAYYVLLNREDVLRQAVSVSIARQTGVWIDGQEPTNTNPQYSFSDIDKCLRQTIRRNSSWRYTLAAHGCNSIEMSFDFIRHNLASAIYKIATFIDVEVDSDTIPKEQVTKKQSDGLNADWAQRFLRDYDGSELFNTRSVDLFPRIKKRIRQVCVKNR